MVAYNLLKRFYGNAEKINFFNFIRERLITSVLGFSYFILSFSKEKTLCIVDSFYDKELLQKKRKVKVFFRLILVRMVYRHTFIFNINKNKLSKCKITFNSKITFNPPKSQQMITYVKSLEGIYGVNRSNKTLHLAILDINNNEQTHLPFTTHPLDSQEFFPTHGTKSNSCLVTNGIYGKDLYNEEPIGHLGKIAEAVGVNDPMVVETLQATSEIMRVCSSNSLYQPKTGIQNIVKTGKTFTKAVLDLNESGDLQLDKESIEKYKILNDFSINTNPKMLNEIKNSIKSEFSFRDNTKYLGLINNGDDSINKFSLNGVPTEITTNSVKSVNFFNTNDVKEIMEKNHAVANNRDRGYLSPSIRRNNSVKSNLLNKYFNDEINKSPNNPFND